MRAGRRRARARTRSGGGSSGSSSVYRPSLMRTTRAARASRARQQRLADAGDDQLPAARPGTRASRSGGRSSPAGPCARIATRLQSASASLSTCELKNTVHPRSRSRRMSARTSRRPSGSRPDIGSSKMTSSGSLMSACAMPTRCSIPFENLRSCSRRSAPMPDLVEQAARRARGDRRRGSRTAPRSTSSSSSAVR